MVLSEKVSVIKGKSAGLASSGGIGEKVSKSKNRSIGTFTSAGASSRFGDFQKILRGQINNA